MFLFKLSKIGAIWSTEPKKYDFADFQNALISQPLDGFLFPTPEMKARDAYVPFLLSEPTNIIEI